MSDGAIVHITGLQELGRSLQKIPAVLATRVMRGALHAAGDVIAAAAELTAPVRTGALRDDMVVKVHVGSDLSSNYVIIGPGYNRGSLRVKGVQLNKRGRLEAIVDTTDSPGVYAKFLEFGTKNMAARPFLRPAFEASKEEAVQAFVAYVRAGLEAVALSVRE